MGEGDDGDDPTALAQARGSGARMHRSGEDIVALVVPGSSGDTTQFGGTGRGSSELAGLVKIIGSLSGSCVKL